MPRVTFPIKIINLDTVNYQKVNQSHFFLNLNKLVCCVYFSLTARPFTLRDTSLFLDFGLSRLTSLQFILCHAAGFYQPTIPQNLPSHLKDYSTCNNARLEFFNNFCSKSWTKWMVPEKWFLQWWFEPRTSCSWVFCLNH